MPAAPLPDNEAERLQALRELLILDTPPEQRFDRIVEFARQEFEVPTVLLSLVDDQRQWFKARVGLDACETSRDSAFCAYAILSPEILLVEDARLDPRFVDNPLVTGPPGIRFYAGAPLEVGPGLRVGTLCLIDYQPRRLDETDLAILGTLRELVQGELLGRGELDA
ncbi:GAF domain-containing protein [Pelomonas sp. SE-A7]|uniref:GAF domain-containing protein n=1 Tax=Pelomonas sp. SE-A7 TaxID=3054953 RepID=UPI00259CB5F7|nr:GAF domain-containing protein [Pelomonas sp. SE-A7]MDM4768167.1 GAF domain-containing protein [Pelomonas sp. SE-A7]